MMNLPASNKASGATASAKNPIMPESLVDAMKQLVAVYGEETCQVALSSISHDEERVKDLVAAEQETNKKLQAKVERERKIEAAILDAAFDSMFAVNESGIIQLVNQKALEQFGYEHAEELVGNNIRMIVGKEHTDNHDGYMKAFLRTGKKHFIGSQREVMARRKDETEFPCVIGIKIVEQEMGKPMFVAFIRDIMEERKAREIKALMEREQKTKAAMLEAAFHSVFAANEEGIIQLVNKKALEEFGYESNELVGQNVRIIVGSEHADRHDGYMQAFMKTGKKNFIGSQREVMARRKDGTEFPCVVGIEIVEQDTGKSTFVAYLRDITEEKRAKEIEIEKRAAEELLLNMLPPEIADRLKADPSHIADHFTSARYEFATVSLCFSRYRFLANRKLYFLPFQHSVCRHCWFHGDEL